MSIIVDASVAAAVVLPDEELPDADLLEKRIEVDGAIAPAIWQIEVANTLIVAVKRKRIDAGEVAAFLGVLDGWMTILQPAISSVERNRVVALAFKHGLTAYDATYLELAVRTSFPLATLDADLKAAAQKENLSLVLG